MVRLQSARASLPLSEMQLVVSPDIQWLQRSCNSARIASSGTGVFPARPSFSPQFLAKVSAPEWLVHATGAICLERMAGCSSVPVKNLPAIAKSAAH